MRVLVACEESQTVCKAFRMKGHEAYSNDVADCSGGSPEWHLKMDCFEAVKLKQWDMIIMHPPCTALAVSGNRHFGLNKDGSPKHRHDERIAAVKWTKELWSLATRVCDRVAMENPVGVLTTMGKLPRAKYIHPYQFGHMEQKSTGLWLHGLKPLVPTDNVYDEMMKLPKSERERIHYLPPSKDRAKIRSKTYDGIAEAMADQWGSIVVEESSSDED